MSFKFDGSLLTSDRTLVDAQVLGDMGLVDGTATAYVGGAGTLVKIDSNKLYQNGATVGAWGETGVVLHPNKTITDEAGRLCVFTVDLSMTAGGAYNGFGKVGVGLQVDVSDWVAGIFIQQSDTSIYLTVNGGVLKVASDFVDGVQESFCVVLVGDGNYFAYRKNGATYTLIGIGTRKTTTNFDFRCSTNSTLEQLQTSGIKIPDTLQPDLVAWDGHDTFTEASDTTLDLHTPEAGTWVIGTSPASRSLSDIDVRATQDDAKGTAPDCHFFMDVGSTKQYVKAVPTNETPDIYYVDMRSGIDASVDNIILFNIINSSMDWQVREWVGGTMFARTGTVTGTETKPVTFEGYVDDTELRIFLNGTAQTLITVGSDASGYGSSTYAGQYTQSAYAGLSEFACKKLDGHTITV